MTKKLKHGNDIYDLLMNIIYHLSPNQAERLYSELLPRYTKRARTKLYNNIGEEDPDGKVRLLAMQYKAIRTKFGDSYVKKAFTELTNYIKYLEENLDKDSSYKNKLNKLTSTTHNLLLTEGWVYDKCSGYVCHDKPKLNVNPFMIEDFGTAKEYLMSVPKQLWADAMDIQSLLLKFPELKDLQDE